ncbi:MAG: ribosomal protein methyltransferase [Bacteroidota bacterium]|nr:ribosomal protein methyltransferase [Bacteroidota bacterium]
MTYIFHIPYPVEIENEEFSGLFSALDIEGMEEKENELCIYLDETVAEEGETLIREICDSYKLSYQKEELENKNWNQQWESSFQPMQIDDFVLVRTTFHPENKNVQYEIIIEPKMSFGTGHHPTTAQMIRSMRLLDLRNKSVLDCGSGTGILSVLAEKMGAKNCIALDNDIWCYQNCIENIELNESLVVQPQTGELETVKDYTFDCILANIHRNFLTANMSILSQLLISNGNLLVSGFYSEDAKLILDKALEYDLIANYHTSQDNWDCIVFKKK